MQTKDIAVGQEYAYARTISRRSNNLRYASRVRVTSLNAKVEGRYGRTERGITAVYLDNKTGRKERGGREFIVTPRQLVATWEQAEGYYADVAEAQDESKREMRKASQTVKALAGRKAPWWAKGEVCRDGSFSTSGEVSIYDLADLLTAAYEKGKADAATS